MINRFAIAAAALIAMASPALAHPGHVVGGGPLVAGFAHPFLGIDHVVAMVAVGLWAALLGGRAVWMVPATFVLGLIGGFGLARAGIGAGFGLVAVEPGIAVSVLVLGILLAGAVRLPLAASMLLVGLFAAFHGHAHGTEASGNALTFALGFVAASVLLQAAGIGLGRVLAGDRLVLARGLGGAAAVIGLALLGGVA